MRWAGWVAAIGLCACGGATHLPAVGGPGDSGSGSTAGDAGPSDAGPADAGDAGPADAGPSADCIGIVPSSTGTAFTFDVPYSSGLVCSAATSDGQGILAAEAHDAGTPPVASAFNWSVFGTNGAFRGSFPNGSSALVPQPVGFEGYSAGDVYLWGEYGGGGPFTPVEQGAVVSPAFGSGSISIGAAASGVSVHRIDANANDTGSGSAQVTFPFTPWAGAEDQSGAILAVLQSGGSAKGIWFDLARGTSSAAFDLGAASRGALARSLAGGGIAVRLDGHWAATVNPFETTPAPAPAWLSRDGTDFTLARGGKAYAVVQSGSNAVELVAIAGSSCGQLAFTGMSSVAVGADGTVVGATGANGCTKIFWRGALK